MDNFKGSKEANNSFPSKKSVSFVESIKPSPFKRNSTGLGFLVILNRIVVGVFYCIKSVYNSDFYLGHSKCRIAGFVLLFSLLLPKSGLTQENYCDAGLETSQNYSFGYRSRGDRCEGIYIQKVGSATLSVVSFISSFQDYDLKSSDDLHVKWLTPDTEKVYLRAMSVKRQLYYRMDTHLPPGSTAYDWTTNVLYGLEIHRVDIGVVAWTHMKLDGREQSVFLPLSIRQSHQQEYTKNYQLTIIPGRELREVFVSFATIDSIGQPDVFLKDGEPLKYGFYPAGRGIVIPIKKPDRSGIYYIEVGATLRSGGSASLRLYFYHVN